jgi:hypothetical protein
MSDELPASFPKPNLNALLDLFEVSLDLTFTPPNLPSALEKQLVEVAPKRRGVKSKSLSGANFVCPWHGCDAICDPEGYPTHIHVYHCGVTPEVVSKKLVFLMNAKANTTIVHYKNIPTPASRLKKNLALLQNPRRIQYGWQRKPDQKLRLVERKRRRLKLRNSWVDILKTRIE